MGDATQHTADSAGTGRPSVRAFGAVFGLGVLGTLVPIVGWIVGVVLAARCSEWSVAERVVAIVVPPTALMALVAAGVSVAGWDRGLSGFAIPFVLSVASAIGGIFLAVRLVAHKRAVEATQR